MKVRINTGDKFFNAWALLRRTADIIARARHKELTRYGITIRQASALHLIQMLGEQATPAEIARAELRQPHTVSAILQTMEEQGLIQRQKDLKRRNQVRAVLTDRGRQAYEDSKKRESIRRIMSCLDDEDLAGLQRVLDKISEAAKQELKKYTFEEEFEKD
jgi:DNA-binding MarR family transcriptional regulator